MTMGSKQIGQNWWVFEGATPLIPISHPPSPSKFPCFCRHCLCILRQSTFLLWNKQTPQYISIFNSKGDWGNFFFISRIENKTLPKSWHLMLPYSWPHFLLPVYGTSSASWHHCCYWHVNFCCSILKTQVITFSETKQKCLTAPLP